MRGMTCAKADEAERRVIGEVPRLGQAVLAGWADGQVAKRADEWERTPEFGGRAKKTLLA